MAVRKSKAAEKKTTRKKVTKKKTPEKKTAGKTVTKGETAKKKTARKVVSKEKAGAAQIDYRVQPDGSITFRIDSKTREILKASYAAGSPVLPCEIILNGRPCNNPEAVLTFEHKKRPTLGLPGKQPRRRPEPTL